jgi:1-acyl-sn-glycerol-3-phosphate acyltransferase
MIQQIKGIIAALVFIINTVVLVSTLLLFALLKLILPIKALQILLSKILVWIAESWIHINTTFHRWLHGQKIHIDEMPELSKEQWYLVVANHQSTVDIPVLQAVFNRKIPFLKFFLKQQLIWVPFLGLAWWALDFPFMKRFSRETLAKKPHLKGKDMEQTKKSCEKFKHFPTSVINFVEGTRFTQSKHQRQQSPYQYLLKPKAGGIGFVMGSMGSRMKTMLLVTIVYPEKVPTVWQYLCGAFKAVHVSCEKIVIPDALLNKNYLNDEKFKRELFKWSENMWYKQDNKLKAFYERTDI